MSHKRPLVFETSLYDTWVSILNAHSSRDAIQVAPSEWWSFSDVNEHVEAISQKLLSTGIKPGNIVLLKMKRGPLWLPVILAVWKVGAIFLPEEDASKVLTDSLKKQIGICAKIESKNDKFDDYKITSYKTRTSTSHNVVGTSSHAYIMPTSGSSGTPKLAFITHATAFNILSGLAREMEYSIHDTALHAASFSFSSSLRQLFAPLFSGARVSITGGFEELSWSSILQRIRLANITAIDFTPSHMRALMSQLKIIKEPVDFPALRMLAVASEPFPPKLLSDWRGLMGSKHSIYHMYGKTETGGSFICRKLSGSEEGQSILPLSQPFPPFGGILTPEKNETSELLVSGFQKDDGILSNGDKFSNIANEYVEGIGWCHATGDLFNKVNEETLIFLTRKDRDLKFHGKRFDVQEFENTISSLIDFQVSAMKHSNETAREILTVAIAETNENFLAKQSIFNSAIQKYAQGIKVEAVCVGPFPLTRTGKVNYPELKSRIDATTKTKKNELSRLETIWQRNTSTGSLMKDDAEFYGSGGDSLSLMSMLVDLNETFNVIITPRDLPDILTLGFLRREVSQKSAADQHGNVNVIKQLYKSDPKTKYKASTFQRGIWLSEKLSANETSKYWLEVSFCTPMTLDRKILTKAMRSCLEHYEFLRASFIETDDFDLEITILPSRSINCFLDDQNGIEVALKQMINSDQLVFAFADIRQMNTKLSFYIHHSIADRQSIADFISTFCATYSRMAKHINNKKDGNNLTDNPSFVSQYYNLLNTDLTNLSEATEFWKEATRPVEHTRAKRPIEYKRKKVVLATEETPSFPYGVSPHSFWLAAFHWALDKSKVAYCNLIGVDFNSRHRDLTGAFGPYVNTLPVPLSISPQMKNHPRHVSSIVSRLLGLRGIPIHNSLPKGTRLTHEITQPYFLYKLIYQKEPFPNVRFGNEPVTYTKLPDGIPENDISLCVRVQQGVTELELVYDCIRITDGIAGGLLETILENVRQEG